MVLIYTTCRDDAEARKLSGYLVEKNLAACVNMWPIESCYIWEGTMRCEKEYGMLVKTLESKVQDVEELISRNHSYAKPFVGTIDVRRVNREYKEWMSEVVH